jgi:YVTN family beta-propeller protein
MTPDGKQAYVSSDRNVSVIDTTTQEVLTTISLGYDCTPYTLVFTPDGKQVYAAVTQAVLVIDTEQKKVSHTIPIDGSPFIPYASAINPNGNQVYVAGENNTSSQVLVIDAKNHSIIKTIHVDETPMGMDITSDGKELYIINSQHDTVSVINTQTYRIHHSISVGWHPRQVIIAPSPE